MITLGIETSCDETACAVVRDRKEVLSNSVSSQTALHSPFGGVVPEIASRAHVESITTMVEIALKESGTPPEAIGLIAVTARPGLVGALVIGLTAAKALSFAWAKPLVAVDHLHAHVAGATLGAVDVKFPAVALVVSGGHTSLFNVPSLLDVRMLGSTTDDAAGEAFDKVANILALGYPGGPAISKAARNGNPEAVPFTRPLLGRDSLDFSFSGLKTAVLYHVRGQQGKTPAAKPHTPDVAASFQEAVADTLTEKCRRAVVKTGYRSLLLGGGVAANQVLRNKLQALAESEGISFTAAKPEFCTDNAAMVAALGALLFKQGHRSARAAREELALCASPASTLSKRR